MDAFLVLSLVANVYLMALQIINWRWGKNAYEEAEHYKGVAGFWMGCSDRKDTELLKAEREIALLRDLIKRRWGDSPEVS